MDGLDLLGAEDKKGFDYGALAQAAGGIIQYGTAAADKDKAEKKSAAEEKASLETAVAADLTAATAAARAAVSQQLKSPSAAIDASAAATAIAAQDRAAAKLSSDAADKRADAAEKALADATKAAQAAPKDGYKAALVIAWTAIVNKAHNTSIVTSDGGSGGGKRGKGDDGGQKNWFVRPVLGPIPGGGVLAIGAGVLAGLAFVVKKLFFK